MDGAALASRIRAEVAAEVAELGTLGLATVLVGDDPASQIYIGKKHEAAREAGIEPHDHHLPAETSEADLLALVAGLNADDTVDGILVQLPLPDHIDESRVLRAVSPMKDVDGFHPASAGQLYLDEPTFVPATPLGIMALLGEYDVALEGKRAVVIGRSTIVGKPAALLLLRANATVTICHSRTRRPRRPGGGGGRSRRRRRQGGRRHGRDGQAGRLRDRRRNEPHRGRAARRRRAGRGGPGWADDARCRAASGR